MEDEKKKRNKKKKNKQTKMTVDAAIGGGETASVNQNHASNGRNLQNSVVQDAEVDLNGPHQLNGTESSLLAEAEKHKLLQREATLEETIKQLKNEKDSYIQKEATLEETIKQLRDKINSHMQKEAALEETIKQLRKENDQKEVILEETVTLLKSENDLLVQKEVTLEETIMQLRNENNLHIQKEAGLEEKISSFLDERATLGLKEASLEEKIKHLERDKESWILMENATKETIASLNDDITRLRMQVVELDESRNSFSQENQQLMGNVASLQLQLQNLEKSISSAHSPDEVSKEALNSQIEAACALVEKLITENAELVEKVNELCIKLDQQSMSGMPSSATVNDPLVGAAETMRVADLISISSETMSVPGLNLESLEDVPIQDEKINGGFNNVEPAAVTPNSSEAGYGEIVQIPLDDNEVRDLESQAVQSDKEAALPLSDAPLIGAPFRFMSFVAKYVSGADLVDKNSLNSRS